MQTSRLDHDVMVNTCDSIELCDIGPNIVVYPDGIIYSHVTTADLPDIIRHLEGGEVVERLVLSQDAGGGRQNASIAKRRLMGRRWSVWTSKR